MVGHHSVLSQAVLSFDICNGDYGIIVVII